MFFVIDEPIGGHEPLAKFEFQDKAGALRIK